MKTITFSSILLLVILFFSGCSTGKEESPHSPFHPAISAFTSGQISVKSPVMVEFTSPLSQAVPGQKVKEGIISFSPSINGEAVWADERTMVFKPSDLLQAGETFKVEINLPRLLPEEKEPFFFTFQTVPQNAWLSSENIGPVSVNNFNDYKATIKVALADVASDEMVEKNVEVIFNGKELSPEWIHSDGRNHLLSVTEITRGEKEETLTVTVKKGPLSPDEKQHLEVIIPPVNSFKILSARIETSPRKLITVVFSDPLDPGQDISGLFTLSGNDLNWNIDNNIVELYPNEEIVGEHTLSISKEVKNVAGRNLPGNGEFTFSFSSEKPAVEIIGDGTIMPYSDGLFMPFRAVSLKAVRVRIIKIYEHNIGHFLQVNQISGNSQLKRAGRLVHKQRIEINSDPTLDLNKWNTFSLDLSRFIQPDPGAIYRIELGFEMPDAIYPCAGKETEASKTETHHDPEEGFWDDSDNYYAVYPYYYNTDYQWRERNNPCSGSYYTRERWVARNVLASNLGLLVKGGTNNELDVTVTDLISATPVANVEVEIFNLQMVKIGNGTTDKEGQVHIVTDGVPFLLIAKDGKQRGYLRLDDGQALAVDRFDVSGETVKEGLRGFIFGERGVWRPGDSLFVSFMPVESTPGTLPPNHPVTFELTDPRGRLIFNQTKTHPENRLYTFRTKTDDDAPTGYWLARVHVGGTVFEKNLRIETIRPNRLKVELETPEETVNSGTVINFNIHSNWLHGSPASNLKSDVRLNLHAAKTSFDGYGGFEFDDPTRQANESELTIYKGILNENGRASFRYSMPVFDQVPGMLRGGFITRVFEKGGAFSVGTTSLTVSPFDVYTGIHAPEGDARGLLLTDEDHQIDVVTVNSQGHPVGNQKLQYTIYKINWRWWWEQSDEELGRFITSGSRRIIDSGTVTTSNEGSGKFDFRINKPEWGRYLIRVLNPASGHSTATTVRVDWPGWARESLGGDGASHLVFSTDKQKYKVGENITVTFPSSDQGRALVSLESGSRVLKSWWVDPKAEETSFEFEATPDMCPNIYISISLIQEYGQSANNRPLRLYGIIPVRIENPDTHLKPELKTSETWRPGEKVEIKVSEANNREMDYVLAVVDEGLLDITNFRTPDPWERFNARQTLGVKTWDLYDEVIGAFGGKIEQLFSVGGDASLSGDKGQNQMQRFEPMVKFFGPYKLKKRGENPHRFEVPSYTGSVRVMVIGTNGRATGSKDAAVKVKKPVMVWTALPRLMGPNEKLSLPVTVFVTEKNIKDVTVTLKGSKHYSFEKNSSKTVAFDAPGEKTVYFDVNTKSLTGSSQLVVEATGNGEKDRLTKNLEVRMPNPPVTQTRFSVVKPKANDALDYTLPGIQGTNSIQLEVSTIPPMDLTGRLNFLLKYPHGCIEQITSGGFPQLYLDKIVDLTDDQREQVRENITSVLQRYSSYQTPEGGFSYWPGQSQPNDWGSSYAGHFLLEAEKQGFMVRPSIKTAWLKWQKERASSWLPRPETRAYNSEQMLQAYRLFTLALAGEPATGAMNRLRQQSNLIAQTRWLLASAYALSGMQKVASEIIDQAQKSTSANVQYGTYGSSLRDKSILIYALTLLERRETAMPMVKDAAKALNSGDWYSTQTTAWALMSIVNFAGNVTDDSSMQYTYTVNNGESSTVGTDKPLSQRSIIFGNTVTGKINFTNDSDKELFVSLLLQGTPGGIDSTAYSENLILERSFMTMDNRSISHDQITQGTDFKYVIRVSNPGAAGDAENLALTQMIPSGWEIRNTRLEGLQSHERDIPDYRDIRDDRVLSYFDLKAGRTKQFVVVVHAAFPGEFYLPPVICEAMYNHSIRARIPGEKTTVSAP